MVDLPKSRSSFQAEHTQKTDPSFQGRHTLIKPTRQTYKTTIPQMTIILLVWAGPHKQPEHEDAVWWARHPIQRGETGQALNGIRLTWPDESTPQKEQYSPQYQINPQQFPSSKGHKVLSTGQKAKWLNHEITESMLTFLDVVMRMWLGSRISLFLKDTG